MEGITSIACITVICYLIGMVCKASSGIKDNYIPAIVGISGLILGVIAFYLVPELMIAGNILDAIAVGIVSGLASTGINQVGKQLAKGDDEDEA